MSMIRSDERSWSHTEDDIINYSFLWKINNFFWSMGGIDRVLNSSTFAVDNDDKIKWRLCLYPKGESERSKHYVSLYLLLVSCDKPVVRAHVHFSILNAREEKTFTRKIFKKFVQGTKWGFRMFIRRSSLLRRSNELVPGSKLTISCEINIVCDTINKSWENNEFNLSKDFGNLFEQQKHSDVILSVDGREFAAHKVILAARSPVFSTMFEHEMEKKKIEINGIDHQVFKEVLQYMYTDRVNNIENMAGDLLVAADMYFLDGLKIMVEGYICSNLTVNNAAEMLILADMLSARQFKVGILNFVNAHVTEIMETPGWKTMQSSHPYLVSDVLQAFANLHSSSNGPPNKRMKH